MKETRKRLYLLSAEITLQTRRQNGIDTFFTRDKPLAGSYLKEQEYDAKFGKRTKRRNVGPCNTYNCHGLTFGAGIAPGNVEIGGAALLALSR
jgi:hypothetical protein